MLNILKLSGDTNNNRFSIGNFYITFYRETSRQHEIDKTQTNPENHITDK